ncbi:MAG: response regulator, partial [Oscillospiraceae bacterium]|nr:response regulator [Oscillospiraceae bacterium]
MVTLTIDDQETSARLMKKMLTSIDPEGSHLIAADMDTALEMLSDEVQIIFLDIEMPGINGIEAADLIQKRYPRMNIIFVTGHPEYAYQAHGAHPSGFLLKPVDETDILHELKHLRFPIEKTQSALKVRCRPFTVFYRNKIFDFKRDR